MGYPRQGLAMSFLSHTINSVTLKMPHLLCLRKSQTYCVYAGYAYTVFASCAKKQDLILGSAAAEYLAIQALYCSNDWWPPKRKS